MAWYVLWWSGYCWVRVLINDFTFLLTRSYTGIHVSGQVISATYLQHWTLSGRDDRQSPALLSANCLMQRFIYNIGHRYGSQMATSNDIHLFDILKLRRSISTNAARSMPVYPVASLLPNSITFHSPSTRSGNIDKYRSLY